MLFALPSRVRSPSAATASAQALACGASGATRTAVSAARSCIRMPATGFGYVAVDRLDGICLGTTRWPAARIASCRDSVARGVAGRGPTLTVSADCDAAAAGTCKRGRVSALTLSEPGVRILPWVTSGPAASLAGAMTGSVREVASSGRPIADGDKCSSRIGQAPQRANRAAPRGRWEIVARSPRTEIRK